MSITYNITTNFGAKDALPNNDPDKVIQGAEFTTEFTAIKTAFTLAAPAASPTFTGTATFADVNASGTITVSTELDATLVTALGAAVGSNGLSVLGSTTLTGDLAVDTNTLVVDATNNYVGIGTSSPAKDLDVDGEFRVRNKFTDYLNISSTGVLTGYSDSWTLTGSSTTTNPTFTVSSIHSTNKSPKVVVDGLSDGTLGNSSGSSGGTYVSDSQGGTLLCKRDNSIVMYRNGGSAVIPDFILNSNGNVGIGATTVSALLHLKDNDPVIRFEDDGGGAAQTYEAGSVLGSFVVKNVTQATQPLTLDASGNVGIGAPSSGGNLQVTSASGGSLWLTDTGTRTFGIQTSGTSLLFRDESAASTRMTIDSSGNLLAGLTSPIFTGTGTHKAQVFGLVEVINGEFSDCDDAYVDNHGGVAEFMSGFQPANRPGTSNYVWIRARTQFRAGTVYIVQECTGVATADLHIRQGSGATAATVTWGAWSAK